MIVHNCAVQRLHKQLLGVRIAVIIHSSFQLGSFPVVLHWFTSSVIRPLGRIHFSTLVSNPGRVLVNHRFSHLLHLSDGRGHKSIEFIKNQLLFLLPPTGVENVVLST